MTYGEFYAGTNEALGIDVEREYALIATADEEGVRMHASPSGTRRDWEARKLAQDPIASEARQGYAEDSRWIAKAMRENTGTL